MTDKSATPSQYQWIEELLDRASANLAGKSCHDSTFEASEMVDVAQTALDVIHELAGVKWELEEVKEELAKITKHYPGKYKR